LASSCWQPAWARRPPPTPFTTDDSAGPGGWPGPTPDPGREGRAGAALTPLPACDLQQAASFTLAGPTPVPVLDSPALAWRTMALAVRAAAACRAHYFAVYGCQPAAETLARTAVSARFMVRMGSPVRSGGGLHTSVDQRKRWLAVVPRLVRAST
jgi:hypothetical protein